MQKAQMSSDEFLSIWQCLNWLAYDDFNPRQGDDASERTLREEVRVAYDLNLAKQDLLGALRNGALQGEGRLGGRYVAATGAMWENFEWCGHGEEFLTISKGDWPEENTSAALDWEDGKLRTPRGEYIDIRIRKQDLTQWRPGQLSGSHSPRDALEVALNPDGTVKEEPKPVAPEPAKDETPEPLRRGRPTEWDWEGALAHLVAVANSAGGLPTSQSKIEGLVASWFSETVDNEPAESAIRKHVSSWCAEVLGKASNSQTSN